MEKGTGGFKYLPKTAQRTIHLSSAARKSMQDSKFSCLVVVRLEKQRIGDANFSGGDMILIGQFFRCWITGLWGGRGEVFSPSMVVFDKYL